MLMRPLIAFLALALGGQASTDRVEKQFNPLGPFQPSGESAGSFLLH